METILTMMKVDLGVLTTTLYDERFRLLISASIKAIMAEGVATLDVTDTLDQQLIAMYAEWLWRKRDGTLGTRQNVDMTVMPRSLRLLLNNRVAREVAGRD